MPGIYLVPNLCRCFQFLLVRHIFLMACQYLLRRCDFFFFPVIFFEQPSMGVAYVHEYLINNMHTEVASYYNVFVLADNS